MADPHNETPEDTNAKTSFPEKKKQIPLSQQLRTMGWNFWVCNLIEAIERLAFFGVSSIRSLFIKTALQLSDSARGGILGTWALIQCLVPMVSGGYTDAYGYRLSMMIAFLINIGGYSLMANATGFWSMFAAACLVGLGTAIFKPPVQGSMAKSLNDDNSGFGFGIFYWVVNIGGAIAPMVAASLRGNAENPTWHYAFYGAAIATAMNFLPAIFLFREPEIDAKAREKKPLEVFAETILILVRDKGMFFFLLIISGFWFMFMQLWDLLPVFLAEWVDTRTLGAWFSWAPSLLNSTGGLKPEMIININPITIILFCLPIAWLFARYKMIAALMIGMIIGTIGFVGTGISMSGVFVAIAIFVFSIGEVICSPKFSEYIGMSAPPDKKALYMGYSNIPFAIGWAGGNFMSGPLYGVLSDRTTFAKRFLLNELTVDPAIVNALIQTKGRAKGKPDAKKLLQLIAKTKALPGSESVEMDAKTPANKKAYAEAQWGATRLLWTQYRPWRIWLILGAVGLASIIGMTFFYLSSQKKKAREDAEA
ncbi:MAG: MFS transporter [Deltaproteobacteria bacterium]|nr:MFS transporter [Deltaproteobacteria bacterium]